MNNLHKQKVISEIHNSTYFLKRHLWALANLYRPKSSMVKYANYFLQMVEYFFSIYPQEQIIQKVFILHQLCLTGEKVSDLRSRHNAATQF